jgi:hypothetical protein
MLQVLLEFIRKNTRDLPCGLKWRKLVKLFQKQDSSFYWYDFNVRGKRFRGSTKETNRKRAEKVAALKLSQTIERRDPLDKKSPSLLEFSTRFFAWMDSAVLAMKSKKYYRNGWRLLSMKGIVGTQLDRIAKDDVETLAFPGSTANVNCAYVAPDAS